MGEEEAEGRGGEGRARAFLHARASILRVAGPLIPPASASPWLVHQTALRPSACRAPSRVVVLRGRTTAVVSQLGLQFLDSPSFPAVPCRAPTLPRGSRCRAPVANPTPSALPLVPRVTVE